MGGAARCLLVAVLLLLAALTVPARADYVNPRFLGTNPWQPDAVRSDESLASLFGRPKGLLRGTDKVREDLEVDPEGGRVIARRRYGAVLVGPEWVQDLRGSVLAASRRSSLMLWRKMVRDEALKTGAARGGDQLTIELPVELPESIANVIGQGARLNLTGSERITFSGTSNIIEGGPQFESGNPSAFPDLDMKQQLRVNLDGTIGEKIHVLVNHDSEVDTDFENKIRLRYEGDEDEVIQKIEMGNTDLALPGSEFLSFRKSQQGLFGAKAEAKLGALDLTVIASKQEGKTATQRFVGRSRRDSVLVRDIEYVKRKYYWAAEPLRLAGGGGAPSILPLEGFELFLDDKDTRNDIADGARIGFAYTDPSVGTPGDSTAVHRGFYHRLIVNQDYTFDPQTGSITLERTVARDHALAAYYRYQDGTGGLAEAGSLDNPDTLQLQLIAPPERELYDDTKGFAPLRDQELKNIYYLGAQNIRPESFEMRILRKASAAGEQNEDVQKSDQFDNVEFLRILGLDYKGLTNPEPDLLVEPEFIDYEDGTITFPNPTPFAPDSSTFNVIVSAANVSTGRSTEPGVPLLEYNPALYELEPDELFRNQSDKYLLEVKYTTPTPTYSLNQFNILEGSERVVLNGRLLSRGADYDIDYEFGVLTFRTPDASLPDAEIEVDFEYVPLFGQAKESLVGLSGTYHFGPRTSLASSWLFFTRATPEERPKLGQEPSRILVGNLYGQWISNPGFMTGIVNNIPLVNTEDESELQIQGEAALSLPNPNTKNQIYIDDMEGVEDSREFAITRGVWSPASEPAGPVLGVQDLDRSGVRPLPFNWYNPENVVRREDVFTELRTEREGQDFLQVLELSVRPTPDVDSSHPDSTGGWLGVMRNLSSIGEDYSEKKFLEVWVNDFGARQGTMVVDLGEISEDFYVRAPADSTTPKGRGFLDTEDVD
ncbi:MAG TPA: cell surface protein SprA, partial [bacterium]|nr:cell surface protein SprA [bacterium]